MSKYEFIAEQGGEWPVREVCRGLGVRASGYYRWRAVRPRPVPTWQPAAQQAFARHAGRYGTRRLRAELRAEGHQVGR